MEIIVLTIIETSQTSNNDQTSFNAAIEKSVHTIVILHEFCGVIKMNLQIWI